MPMGNSHSKMSSVVENININITYKPDGTHIAVGNSDDELTILDVRKFKPVHKRKFNYEPNVQMGRTVHQIPCRGATNSVEWNPKHNFNLLLWLAMTRTSIRLMKVFLGSLCWKCMINR
ncbi:THO complex subunit 3-like isoform X2 [Cucurbita moschata]|uniref:THO complex subunit 3-like isoform X2 n=1 Tax=Cucurbita moschata TaxID=3662 RepID=A0A6J1EW21_CUCMO|nr:THO complex subunit 3-like isoform X2 [Cucurbita moschata]